MSFAIHAPASRVSVADFDVVAEFAKLEISRKMVLFDQLMANRLNAYRNTMRSFWPGASEDDARKLELVLRHRLDKIKPF